MNENLLAFIGGMLGGVVFAVVWYLIGKWRDKA